MVLWVRRRGKEEKGKQTKVQKIENKRNETRKITRRKCAIKGGCCRKNTIKIIRKIRMISTVKKYIKKDINEYRKNGSSIMMKIIRLSLENNNCKKAKEKKVRIIRKTRNMKGKQELEEENNEGAAEGG